MIRGFKLRSHSFVSTFISHVCTHVENLETKHFVFSYIVCEKILIFIYFKYLMYICKYMQIYLSSLILNVYDVCVSLFQDET